MELIRDFLEDFGGVVVMSFLVMTTASLATGVIPIVLMFLGISAVIFLIWFFYMYGRAVQVLMEIWFGKIQVKTKQQIFFRPQFFTISNADHEHDKVYKVEKEKEEIKKIIYDMMELCCPVDVCCNIYQDSVTGTKLIGEGKFIRLFSFQLPELLQLEKMQYMQQTGSIIKLKGTTKSEPVCMFLRNSKSVLDVAFNKLFQDILQMYRKGMDLQTEELYRLYGDMAREVTFDYATSHAIRVDYMQFKPLNNTVSGIEKGDFFCFDSKNGHNFLGDYNYYVMPEEVYEQIKAEIPYGVGVYVPGRLHHGKDWYDLKSVRKAKRKDREKSLTEMLFMMFRSAARDRKES